MSTAECGIFGVQSQFCIPMFERIQNVRFLRYLSNQDSREFSKHVLFITMKGENQKLSSQHKDPSGRPSCSEVAEQGLSSVAPLRPTQFDSGCSSDA